MLFSLVNDGLLDTSEAIHLQAIFSESTSLIEDHHVYSS